MLLESPACKQEDGLDFPPFLAPQHACMVSLPLSSLYFLQVGFLPIRKNSQ